MFKICSGCKRNLPLSRYYFHKCKATKDEFHTKCKECRGKKFGESKERSTPRTKNNLGIIDGKIECNKCKRLLPLSSEYFFKHKSVLGYEPICKECKGREFGRVRKYSEYKIINEIEYKKCNDCNEFFPNTSGYFRIISIKNNQLSSFCITCDKIRQKKVRSRKSYKIKHALREQRRRATKNNLSNSLTMEEWQETLKFWTNENGEIQCAYCGKEIKYPEQEHIIPVSKNGGFIKENIIPVGGIRDCACNQSKKDKSLNEFYLVSESFTKENYLKIKEFILSHISINDKNSSVYSFLF